MANDNDGRLIHRIRDGIVIVGSDAHYWPGKPYIAHRAFIHFIRKMSPQVVICNGDAFDGASISRHPPIGWERRPTVAEEITVCQIRMKEISDAASNAKRYWTIGNHDFRFNARLATLANEFSGVPGFHLKNHFPEWTPCMSVWLNDVVVKHRFKGGDNAPMNNTMRSGRSFITGHLHSAHVRPYSDYNGTRYGVDTGCLANPIGGQFHYCEDNPKNWLPGFGVLTFINGKMLMPELVTVFDKSTVQFRGELIKV
jgi:hypothetical protein